jgi:hypothetical protein
LVLNVEFNISWYLPNREVSGQREWVSWVIGAVTCHIEDHIEQAPGVGHLLDPVCKNRSVRLAGVAQPRLVRDHEGRIHKVLTQEPDLQFIGA